MLLTKKKNLRMLQIKKIDEAGQGKSQDPRLFKKWYASDLSGYVSDEYRNLKFTI